MFRKIVKGLKDVWCGTLEFDTEPKKGSFNPVTSDAVYDAINGSAGAKEIVYFDVDPSDPPSGIYAAITEALSNNKEPVIKNDGTVYFYSSTSTGKYVFVGGYDTDVVNYTTVTVSDDDSVVKETVDTIEGMVFPLYYHPEDEGFTVADKTGHALTKTEIADAYRAGQIFMFSSYPASNTQAHWGYCCDINIDSDNTGYAEFFILAAFGGNSYKWEKYRINLSSGTEFVTLWGPNTSYSTGYSGSYANASDVAALQSQVSSLSDVSAYSVKGEATVAQLNAGPSGIQAGWAYQLTDSGTLTDGSLAVVAGDTVAWDGTKWFPLVKSDYYATKIYAQNVAHSIAPEFDPTRTSENPYPKNSSVAHEGKVYNFFKPHYGPWTGTDVKESRSAPNNLVKFQPIVLDKINEASDITYESGVLKTNGEVQVISGFHTSDFIEVDVAKTYQARLSSFSDDYFQICLYDANKNLIGGVNEGATPVEVAFNFASAVKYFRISINASFYVKERLASSPILFNTDIDFTLELLDSTKFTANTYIGSSGQEVSFNGATASDYIPVTAGLSYAIRDSFGGSTAKTAFYDFTKKFISATNSENATVTAPANAKYMRVSLRTAYIATASVCKGSLPLPSIAIPYGQTQFDIINTLFVPAPYVQMEMLDLNKDVTFDNGVFDQSSSDQFKTSDYINLITTGTAKSEFFFVLRTTLSSDYDLIRFYDKDKNVIATVKGGDEASIGLKTTYPYKIIAPKNCVYIRYAQGVRVIEESWGGIATLKFGAMPDYIRPIFFTETNNLLWIGTSIPEGAEYPMKSSKACDYNCINKSLGSSMLRFTGVHPTVVEEWSGKCLTATVDELENLYRDDVTSGIITEERLNIWKNYSYENSIIPYIDGTNDVQVSAIVLDHGFNDKANIHTLMQNPSGIDWTSTDRANFVGAFNYLYRKILEVNPFVKLIISGYFQNIYDGYYSKDICDMQELIADKYDLPLMPAWKYSGINFEYVPGSSDYIANFNSTYNTNHTKMNPDGEGNIPLFQFFCPDKVHPHSDKTGNCNRRLNAVYTKLLKDSL